MGEPAEESAFGQYIIDEKIAQGGMAEIFRGRATDPYGLERPVVIKRILPHIAASPEFVEMLVQEAKLAVQLSHGNIAQIYDLGKVGEDYFMVMEYVEGKSLSQIARRLRMTGEKIPASIAFYIISEVANGLDYMHHKSTSNGKPLNIIHRDISPQNIIISRSGTIKIIDFGIAKAESQISTTDSGVVKGKFAYMSPEHAQGERLDARTDIFSLGVILWELLTNQRLFKGKNNKETLQRVKRCRVPSVLGYRDDIPKDAEKILKKALSKNRKNRYNSSHDFLLDLIRTLVHHHSSFAPKDLENYLKRLFTDQWEDEKIIAETQLSKEALTEIDEREATALADPKVLKLRLRELEHYRIPEEEKEKPPPEAEPKPEAPEPEAKKEPRLRPFLQSLYLSLKKRLPHKILSRWVIAIIVIVGLGYAASFAFNLIEQWTEKPIPAPPPKLPLTPPRTLSSRPAPKITYGNIRINSVPEGARIYINDRDSGQKTPALLEKMKADQTYRIGLYHNQYRYWEQKVLLSSKETLTIHADLRINFGALQITSEPPGAAVWLGKAKRGVTPLRIEKLTPGEIYQIRVSHEGFAEWSREVKIFAGRTQSFRAVLHRK